MVDVPDADAYRFATLLAKSASYDVREMGWSALADVDVAKYKYRHGWILIGGPEDLADHHVHHDKYGHGRVSHVDEHGHAHVKFDSGASHSFEHQHGAGKPRFEQRPRGKAPQPAPPPKPEPKTAAKPVPKPRAAKESYTALSRADAQAMQAGRPKWTPEQKKALGAYSSLQFVPINEHLRFGKKASVANQRRIAEIDSTMHPSDRPILLTRHATPEAFGFSHAATMTHLSTLRGKTVEDKGFMSTSIDPGSKFKAAIRVEIEAPTGTRMAFVRDASRNANEDEMLLDRGLRYKIQSVTDLGAGRVPRYAVRMRVVK